MSSQPNHSVQVFLGSTAAVSDDFRNAAPHATEQFTVHDGLSIGPLKPLLDANSWNEMRREYWRTLLGSDEYEEEFPLDDVGKLRSANEIVIWLSTSLDDQIGLAWLPAFLRAIDVDSERLRMIQFHRSESGREIIGLGMLNPQQLASHPAATRVTKNDLRELDTVWSALSRGIRRGEREGTDLAPSGSCASAAGSPRHRRRPRFRIRSRISRDRRLGSRRRHLALLSIAAAR
jgi:hypothetical protein